MSYLKIFLRAFFLVFLIFLLSGCAILEKQRQQVQVLLSGKTFTVENRSEDSIYFSLLEWSGKNSSYRRLGNLDIGDQKSVTISGSFFTERGNFNLGGSRDLGRDGRGSSFITYQVTFTVSGNQVTAVPRLRRYCRGNRGNESGIIGNFTDFRCQKIDNSFNGFTFRVLSFFNNFYDRVERIVGGRGNY